MINPVHLRTLSVVVRLGSFADASRELGYTPSAVSQQIAALERRTGLKLFERDAHSIRPTSVARVIAERAAGALGTLRLLEEDINMLASGKTGRLRIGSFPTATRRLLPRALSALHLRRPDLDVRLDELEPADSLRLLESRDLDVALVYEYSIGPPLRLVEVELHPVLSEEIVVIAPPPRLNNDAPRSTKLADHTQAEWICTREDTAGAEVLTLLCRAAGFEPRVALRSNNYSVIQELVHKRLGVALIPAMALETAQLSHGNLDMDGRPRRHVSVAASSEAPPALVNEFVQLVRSSAGQLCGPGEGIKLLER